MMRLKLRFFRAALLLAAFFVAVQLGSASNAMAVYNYTSIAINADFDCGWFCEKDWDPINASDSKSRPNEAGSLYGNWEDGDNVYSCSVDVDTHGYVVATGSDGTSILLTSYRQDGTIRETCYFVPESGFPLV